MNSIDNSWVLFRLVNQTYGLPTASTLEMVVLKQVNSVPHSNATVRGVINLRGTILPVLDLRVMLGLPSRLAEVSEMVTMLKTRKQEHVSWLEELKSCIHEKRDFKLALDPRQCKFGKWYYQFTTDDIELKMRLPKFEAPHCRIHEIGVEALKLIDSNKQRAALQLIEEDGANILDRLIYLFDDTIEAIKHSVNEIVVVIQHGERKLGVIVDEVCEVSEILPESVRDPLQTHHAFQDLLSGVTTGQANTNMLLNVNRIVESVSGRSSAIGGEVMNA